MKKLFYLVLSALFLLPVHVVSEDTFYVSSTGSNSNPGTQSQPWGSLNPGAWTDGCTIIVLDEIYQDPVIEVSRGGSLSEITIQGDGPDAAIMALNDDEFNDGEINLSSFFELREVKLTLKDITLKNLIRRTGNGAGGMIYVDAYSELNLDNVVMKNSSVGTGEVNIRGGAVWSAGKLTAQNSIFENCKAYQGGAIFLKEMEEPISARFENCTFSRNETGDGSVQNGPGAGGGALWIEGLELDVVFETCYFDSNYAKNGASDATGGAIRLQLTGDGSKANVVFSNCTMANNKSKGQSGFFHWKRQNESEINLKFVNNVFYKNRTEGPEAHFLTGQIGGANQGISGSLIFVNNTSIFNNTGADNLYLPEQSAMNITDCGGTFDLIFVNNIMLDRMTEPVKDGEDQDVHELGFGWTMRERDSRIGGTYIIKNNVHDGVSGHYDATWGEGFLFHFKDETTATANENRNIEGQTAEQKLTIMGIDGALTSPVNGVPYIPIILEDGFAVDAGISNLIYKGEELIPQTDIRGVAITGSSRDLGAFEFNGTSSVAILKDRQLFVYPNPVSNTLNFSQEIISAKIYSVSGACLMSATNTKSMNVESLTKGIYLVQILDNQGNSYTHRILK